MSEDTKAMDPTGEVLRELITPEGLADPFSIYSRLRERQRAGENIGRIVVTYEEAREVLSNKSMSSDRAHAILSQLAPKVREEVRAVEETLAAIVAFRDPPGHTTLRRLLVRAFNPKVVARQSEVIEKAVSELFAPLEELDSVDLRPALTYPLPSMVVAGLLGIPESERKLFGSWANDIVFIVGSGRADEALARKTLNSVMEMRAYMSELVAKRRKEPGDDLLSSMLEAVDEGRKLTEDEVFANSLFLMTAGHETATNLLGNAIVNLLTHPDQLALLREDWGLLDGAIEEVLRFEGPVQMTARIATEPIEVAGHRLEAGQPILVFLGAANRDPERFPEPDRFDIRRQDNNHLAFSYGAHFCLGAHLAREEARAVLRKVLGSHRQPELLSVPVPWQETVDFRGPTKLEVAWEEGEGQWA
jgi:cytochrome P450